jgi:glutamate synthase (NADH)
LPELGKYATGIFYLDKNSHEEAEKEFQELADSIGLAVLGWRDVPVNSDAIGQVALKSEPLSRQVFITADLDEDSLNKQVNII